MKSCENRERASVYRVDQVFRRLEISMPGYDPVEQELRGHNLIADLNDGLLGAGDRWLHGDNSIRVYGISINGLVIYQALSGPVSTDGKDARYVGPPIIANNISDLNGVQIDLNAYNKAKSALQRE